MMDRSRFTLTYQGQEVRYKSNGEVDAVARYADQEVHS